MSWKTHRSTAYSQKLLDPRWQRRRLEVLSRDNFACVVCSDDSNTLHVHHRWYERGKEPWDYPLECFATLCAECHEHETENRAEQEQEFLATIKRHFFGFELCQIGKMLANMPIVHVPEVQLTGMAWFLSNRECVERILEDYFSRGCPQPGELFSKRVAALRGLSTDGHAITTSELVLTEDSTP